MNINNGFHLFTELKEIYLVTSNVLNYYCDKLHFTTIILSSSLFYNKFDNTD